MKSRYNPQGRKHYVVNGRKFKVGSWGYIKNHNIRAWAKNKEREALAGTEKKIGKAGHVYIFSLGHDGLYKVGFTCNVERRLKALRIVNTNIKCVWSAWVRDAREAEKALHRQFQNQRIDRELFKLTPGEIVAANQFINKFRGDDGYEVK